MKKIIFLFIATLSLSFAFGQKKLSKKGMDTLKSAVEFVSNLPPQLPLFSTAMQIPQWNVFFRNLDRLAAMAGRSVNSDLLFSTQDTIAFFRMELINQLNAQLPKDSTAKKK